MINNSELGVLIAEDESRILALIKSLIDWEGLPLRLVGEATDGDSALKMIVDNQLISLLQIFVCPVPMA